MLITLSESLYRFSTAALLTLMLFLCQELSVPSSPLIKFVHRTSQSIIIGNNSGQLLPKNGQ